MPLDSAAAPKSSLTLETRPWEDAMIVQCKGRLTVEHSEAMKNHVRNLLLPLAESSSTYPKSHAWIAPAWARSSVSTSQRESAAAS